MATPVAPANGALPRGITREFPAQYKAAILAEYDSLDRRGRGQLLRREDLYASLIRHWRAQRAAGRLVDSTSRRKVDEVFMQTFLARYDAPGRRGHKAELRRQYRLNSAQVARFRGSVAQAQAQARQLRAASRTAAPAPDAVLPPDPQIPPAHAADLQSLVKDWRRRHDVSAAETKRCLREIDHGLTSAHFAAFIARRESAAPEVIRRYRGGESLRQVSVAVRLAFGTVRKILMEAGEDLRPVGKRPRGGPRARRPRS